MPFRTLLPLLAALLPLFAADAPHLRPVRSIRVNSTIVLVGVSVTDPRNQPVTSLAREHFRIFDDKVEQPLEYFSVDEAPVSIGVVFDTSRSMKRVAGEAREALLRLVESSNPEDEGLLVTVNNRPRLAAELTRDLTSLPSRLSFTNSSGCTALHDAMVLGLHELGRANHRRKALVVISDGYDNNSRYTARELTRMVRESDVQIFTIGVRDQRWEEVPTPHDFLLEIAEATGGRGYIMTGVKELKEIAGNIGSMIRSQYVLGFRPKSQARDGRFHRVRVKVSAPQGYPRLTPYWRMGYYSPAE